jgi:small subunit ribosomal protein S16
VVKNSVISLAFSATGASVFFLAPEQAATRTVKTRLLDRVGTGEYLTGLVSERQRMSVKIRLSRQGAKKNPFYRVVATDSRSPRDGRFIEQIGVYDPTRDPVEFRYDEERMAHWLKVGAEPSDTIRELLKKAQRAAAEKRA